MDGLPTWVRWIIVAVVGLSPMLVFLFASAIGGLFLRRKLRQRVQREAPVSADRSR
jgi:hypothetical protein